MIALTSKSEMMNLAFYYFGDVFPKAGLSIASLHCALSRS
jgi:hypothetical protein